MNDTPSFHIDYFECYRFSLYIRNSLAILFAFLLILQPSSLRSADSDSATALVNNKYSLDFNFGTTKSNKSKSKTLDNACSEIAPNLDDAAVDSINSPSLPFKHGTNPFVITLRNEGSNNLTSTDINWEINGSVQAVYNWTGDLEPDSTEVLQIGSFDFELATAYDVKVWTTLPNGNPDGNTSNDIYELEDLYASLAGHYTIGANMPDFATVGEAVVALNLGGVAQPVWFRLRAGQYDEQIEILKFPGADCSRPVFFESESGDSLDVVLSYSASEASNYTIRLNGAKGVTFRDLTLQAVNEDYGTVVSVVNETDCSYFSRCLIKGNLTSSVSRRRYLCYSLDSKIKNSGFANCTFENGSAGVFLVGDGEIDADSSIIVIGCDFINNSRFGAYIENHKNVELSDNLVVSNSNNISFVGIQLEDIDSSFVITRNRINILKGTGIRLRSVFGRAGNESKVVNNMISVGGNETAYGIDFDRGSHVKFLHNNVNIYSTQASSGRAFFKNRADGNITLLNNVFSNHGGGYSVYYAETNGLLIADYNNLYSTGAAIGYWDGDKVNLQSLQDASGMEQNSKSVDPLFYSDTDLHVNKALLDKAGVTTGIVPLDFDYEMRYSPPDIGADEFVPFGVNASLESLIEPIAPFIPGNKDIKVSLINSGANMLTTCEIKWKLNDVVQPSFFWTGILYTNQRDTITLGLSEFLPGINYNIHSWVENPNSMTDIDPSDDTLKVNNIVAALNGTYTVGGTNPVFATPADAVLALNNAGVSGAVTFNIRSGTYNEQLHIHQFPGADCSTPVIFRSETGDSTDVIISHSASIDSNYTVFLDGADGVTIENITLEAEHTKYATVLRIGNKADCNSILSNHFIGSTNADVVDDASLIYSSYDNEFGDHNLFAYNLLENGLHGIAISPLSSQNKSKGTEIRNNICKNNYYAGISVIYQDSVAIEHNFISSNSSTRNGIQIYDSEFVVSNNKIILSNGGEGIFVYDFYISLGGVIANNFISVGGTQKGIGIEIDQLDHINLYHNSVNITNTHSQSLALYVRTARKMQSFNNILSNPGGNYAMRMHSVPSSMTSDYNALFTSGPDLIYAEGYILSLSEFQAEFELDLSSVFIEPAFVSETDLHISDFSLDRRGVPVTEVIFDIDGQNRDLLFPDIGADEFDSPDNDAGVSGIENPNKPFSEGLQEIIIDLYNYGQNELLSVNIDWSVNGVNQPPYNWLGNLLTRDTVTVTIGNFIFEGDSTYDIKAYTSLPNGVVDQSFINDTFELADLKVALNGAYTIGGAAPDFNTISEAVSALNIKGVTGPVIFNVRDGVYNEQIELVEISGASSVNNIVFQSESLDSSLVTLSYSASHILSNYTLYINGADHIAFQHMTITAANSLYGRVIYIDHESLFVKLCNNLIKGVAVAPNSANFLTDVIASLSGNDHNLSIVNNRIENGHEAIRLSGESNSSREYGVSVSGNIIVNPNWEGINLQYLYEPKVIGNSISNALPVSTRTGILLNDVAGSFRIEQNSIIFTGGIGIALENCNSSLGMEGSIANNFISIGDEFTSFGIKSTQSTFQNYYYNSVNMFGSLSHLSRALNLSASSDITLANNVFVNSVGGFAIFVDGENVIKYSDNNNIYSSGNYLAKVNGNFIYDIMDWRSITGQGINSLSVEVCFNSFSDLHTGNASLESAGIPIPGILYDIDGEIRNTLTPDIGADEFTCLSNLIIENETLTGDQTFRSSAQIELKNVVLNGNVTLMTPSVIVSDNSTVKAGAMMHFVEKNGCN